MKQILEWYTEKKLWNFGMFSKEHAMDQVYFKCQVKKNAGQVKNLQTDKGRYDLTTGSFNFAVPDVKTIVWHAKKVDQFLYAGILHGSFDVIDKMKQYVLECDAKRIASGLQDNNIGDVDIWGYEGPPSFAEAKAELDRCCA